MIRVILIVTKVVNVELVGLMVYIMYIYNIYYTQCLERRRRRMKKPWTLDSAYGVCLLVPHIGGREQVLPVQVDVTLL